MVAMGLVACVSGWWVAPVAEIASVAFSVLQVVRSPDSAWTSLIMPAAYLIFLFWLRRCFRNNGTVSNGSALRASRGQ